MAILTRGSGALILDPTGTTILGAVMALQDVDFDALLASNPRVADLVGVIEQFTPSYWLDWVARHPEYDWKTVFATRLATQAANGRLSRFLAP